MRITDRELERVPWPECHCAVIRKGKRRTSPHYAETLSHDGIGGRSMIDIAMDLSRYRCSDGDRIMLTDHSVWYVWRAGKGGSVSWLRTEL